MKTAFVARLLGIEPSQLRRAIPFFAVYVLLFAGLTMADAVAVALFTSRIGANALPTWYSVTAIASLLLIGVYLTQATRMNSKTLFGWILATLISLWIIGWLLCLTVDAAIAPGMLFVTREIALTMVLMHFGTFLQDYFLRSELNRILPTIYAGGRVGGILGGLAVGTLAGQIGTVNLILVTIALVLLAWFGIILIGRMVAERDEPEESHDYAADQPQGSSTEAKGSEQPTPELISPHPNRIESVIYFLRQVATLPLLTWITITTLLFVVCRWILAFQYTAAFESHFDDEVKLAGFLGFYTQVALLISLFLQLFVVTRLVNWLGVAKAHLTYTVMVAGALVGNIFFTGLPIGIVSRFVEAELRFGLRNPVNQMLINQFSKKMRIKVRGWSLGWLIPIGTLFSSGLIASLLYLGGHPWVALAGLMFGMGYVLSAIMVGRAYDKNESKKSVV